MHPKIKKILKVGSVICLVAACLSLLAVDIANHARFMASLSPVKLENLQKAKRELGTMQPGDLIDIGGNTYAYRGLDNDLRTRVLEGPGPGSNRSYGKMKVNGLDERLIMLATNAMPTRVYKRNDPAHDQVRNWFWIQ